MIDCIVIFVLLTVLAPGVVYIVREKKKGRACIGCPYAGRCHGRCGGQDK